jgi:peptidoglycan/LPS O-acetylase OafA/YrhL
MLPPGKSDYTAVGLTYGHLWFILFLFAISLVALPLILLLRTGGGRRAMAGLAGYLQKGAAILLLALPLPFVLFLLPEFEGQPFFMYLLVFLYGFVLMSDARYGESLQKSRRAALILAVICTTILMAVWISGREFADFSLPDILLFFLESFVTWFWIAAILGYGQKYLNVENRVLRYAREGSYPFYIVHQTVIVIIGYYVVQWSAAVLPKFLVIAGCSLVVSIALYDVVVRRTNVTRFLFGMRPLPRQPSAPEVPSPSGRPAV